MAMDRASITEARSRFGEVIDRARFTGRATVITDRGKDAAVIVPVDRYARLLELEDAAARQRAAEIANAWDRGELDPDVIGREELMRMAGLA